MKTRFDYSGVWITGVGEAVPRGQHGDAALIEELQERGVNTKNVLSLYSSSEAFQQ